VNADVRNRYGQCRLYLGVAQQHDVECLYHPLAFDIDVEQPLTRRHIVGLGKVKGNVVTAVCNRAGDLHIANPVALVKQPVL
jgi:hypothetical protein